jgi:hypothetical protein
MYNLDVLGNVLSEIKDLKKRNHVPRKCKWCNGTDHSMITSRKCPFQNSIVVKSNFKRLQSKAKSVISNKPLKRGNISF